MGENWLCDLQWLRTPSKITKVRLFLSFTSFFYLPPVSAWKHGGGQRGGRERNVMV